MNDPTKSNPILDYKYKLFIKLIATICLAYSVYIALNYINQIPLDLSSFRQTQTALTAYWIVKNGFSFAYETPVLGYPWSVPFEFPIYQYIVAIISSHFNISLNATGRFISYIFLIFCLIPTYSITKKLKLSNTVFYIFIALLLSNPIYLYHGRTFMIETAAVFFILMAIKFFLDVLDLPSVINNLLFFIFLSLALLQKTTTALPIFFILGIVFLYKKTNYKQKLKPFLEFNNIATILAFLLSMLLAIAWVKYTDQIKSENPVGQLLTSAALHSWNFGTLEQRFSSGFYINIIGLNIILKNLCVIILPLILLARFRKKLSPKELSIIIILIIMGVSPLFIFSNLHIAHGYYQVANVIFLLYAASIVMSELFHCDAFAKVNIKLTASLLLILFITANYLVFKRVYFPSVSTNYTNVNSRDLALSQNIKQHVVENDYFIVFGYDWTSSLAYLSERKSFTVPEFYKKYKEIFKDLDGFLSNKQLGAVVACPMSDYPEMLNDLNQWAINKSWRKTAVWDCFVYIPPEKTNDLSTNVSLRNSDEKPLLK
jgi:Dolichyl-phosphate-mannose-protein mannosyltransferase